MLNFRDAGFGMHGITILYTTVFKDRTDHGNITEPLNILSIWNRISDFFVEKSWLKLLCA